MAPEMIASGIRLSLTVAAVILVFQYVYVPARVSYFRQRIFDLRHELFALGETGRIAFTDPAYTRMRGTMNRMLRYAERLTFLRFASVLVVTWREVAQEPDETRAHIEALPDPALRAELNRIRGEFGVAAIRQVLWTSPLCWVLILVLLLAVLVTWIVKGGPLSRLKGAGGRRAESVLERLPDDEDGEFAPAC